MLYNGLRVFSLFDRLNIKAVSLANNHVNDTSKNYENTIDQLDKHSIQWFGAGRTAEEARRPVVLNENGIQYVIFGFGWKVIGCRRNSQSDLYINQLTEENAIRCTIEGKKAYPEARIVLFMHWDYELEALPQPLHRVIAHKAIENGAYAVIGCHPHCVQPIEVYKDKLIAYSLGNFIIPNGCFMSGRLNYPVRSRDEMVVELNVEEFNLYHFKYDGDNTISMLADYDINESNADFLNLNEKEYVEWFKKNRVKKKLLPVFTNKFDENLNYKWVKIREKVIRKLFQLNLKSGPS